MRLRLPVALVVLGLAGPLGWTAPANAATAAAPYDFNGDGYRELVVGAPSLRVGSVRDAGGVVVLRASSSGVSTSKKKVITQSSAGVPGGSESGDAFGYALASGDFDRDGYADLAIGQPGEEAGAEGRVGAVTVVYGSRSGLTTSRSVSIARPGSGGLGAALVAGDFDRDGYPDLAIGSPGEDDTEIPDEDYGPSGVVHVVPGGPRGLGATDLAVLHRKGGTGRVGFDVGFGARLAAGDLNRDGVTDLVVGADGDRFVDEGYPGSVSACLGARVGGPSGCTQLRQDSHLANMSALAVGNVSGSATPEVVVGTALYSEEDSGRVSILQLEDLGAPALARTTEITQDSPGVPGSDEVDGFGSSVAVGDIDRDGYADLVIGADREDDDRGRVTVVRGASGGYARSGNVIYDQSTKGVPGTSEKGDFFGSAVSLLDHDHDGDLDLSVGAQGEDGYDGAVTILEGSGKKLPTRGAKAFSLRSLGYAQPDGGYFGSSLGQ